MIPQFIVDFDREFTKIMPPGNLTFETDGCLYNFHWDDVFVKCDFPIVVPIDSVGHNRVVTIAQIEAYKIIREHYL